MERRPDRGRSRTGPRALPRTGVGRLPAGPPRYARRRARRVLDAGPPRRHRTVPGTHAGRPGTRSLVFRDDDTDHRGHLRRCAVGGRHRVVGHGGRARRRIDGIRPLPPAGAPRSDRPLRRVLLLQQRCGRRSPRVGHDRRSCDDPRRRLSPRQWHAADLLPARRRAVRVAPRWSGARVPLRHGLRRRARRRSRGRDEPERSPRRGPTTTPTSAPSRRHSTPSRRSGRAS